MLRTPSDVVVFILGLRFERFWERFILKGQFVFEGHWGLHSWTLGITYKRIHFVLLSKTQVGLWPSITFTDIECLHIECIYWTFYLESLEIRKQVQIHENLRQGSNNKNMSSWRYDSLNWATCFYKSFFFLKPKSIIGLRYIGGNSFEIAIPPYNCVGHQFPYAHLTFSSFH